MNVIQVAVALSEMLKAGRTVFMALQPEVADYTANKFPTLVVFGTNKTAAIPLDPTHIKSIVGILQGSVLGPDVTVIGWNFKNILSHIGFLTRKPFKPDCTLFDLKLLEAYLGDRGTAPATFLEAVKRLKVVVGDRAWGATNEVYKKVHLPLTMTVVPGMETHGLLDEKTRKYVYPYYEIEGQKSGRMKCLEPFADVYNPHVIGPDDKERLLPRHRDEVFMYFDFHNMELAMVQWLSGDEKLKEMMEAGDVYANIYKAIKGTADRTAGKNLFLPVIYGESPERLAKEWEISPEDALYHVRALESMFRTAFDWVGRECENGEANDHFGRRRKFADEEPYKVRNQVRNFYVQSPGSLVCLEKLIRLDSVLSGVARIVCHVHDGYIVAAKKDTWRDAYRLSVDALEGPSEWCPGLKLSVGCQAGRKLNEMSVLKKVTKGRM